MDYIVLFYIQDDSNLLTGGNISSSRIGKDIVEFNNKRYYITTKEIQVLELKFMTSVVVILQQLLSLILQKLHKCINTNANANANGNAY